MCFVLDCMCVSQLITSCLLVSEIMIIFKVMFFIVVYVCYVSVHCYGNLVDDYYWRDYHGVTPSDALKAGKDKNGRPIYVGQVLYDNKLIPGKIHENVNEIHIEFHDAHVLSRAVKILCTTNPEMFEWIQTRHDNVLNIRNNHIIIEGGYEADYTTYVGRAVSHGELTVGKVICHGTGCYKLTTIENKRWFEHDIYEILTYNPDAKINRTTSTTTSSTPATFYTEVYRRHPPSTVGHRAKVDEKQSSTIATSTIDFFTTVVNQTAYFIGDPALVGYNSGACGMVSIFFVILLSILHCYQIYQGR